MKINITIDITPEELREALGLPDFNAFNQDFINKMSEKIKSGNLDTEAFFQTMNPATNPIGKIFMKAAMQNMEMMKQNTPKNKKGKETKTE